MTSNSSSRQPRPARLYLTLYVAGDNAFSRQSRDNLAALVATADVQAKVTVVDVFEHPELALRDGIFVTPALIITATGGRRSLIVGDLSEQEKVLGALRGWGAQTGGALRQG